MAGRGVGVRAAGAAEIFPPGTVISEAAERLMGRLGCVRINDYLCEGSSRGAAALGS